MHCLVVAIAVMTVLVPAASGCIEPMCALDCGRVTGDDGCPQCSCPPTCETLKCNATEACYLQQVQCFTTPCYPVAECRPKSEVCPVYKLQANCYTREREGQCDEVVCPCETTSCSETEVCTLNDNIQCFAAPCYPVAECKPKSEVCPMARPAPNCYTREVTGQCDEIFCPCQTMSCSETEVCTLNDNIQCFAAPCYPVAECKPKSEVCPMVRPAPNCYTREVTGQCNEVVCPCQTVKCTAGNVCRLQKVTCIKAPCYPRAKCVPVCPIQKPCAIRCATPLKVDKNGCQLCQCS